MSVELILLAVNLNLVAFSAFLGDLTGQVFALLVLTVAAAESAIGLAILVVYYRNKRHDRGRRHQHDEGLSVPMMYDLIVFLPLFGAMVAGLFGRWTSAPQRRISDHDAARHRRCALSWIGFFQVGLGHARGASWPSWSRSPTGSRSAS